MLFAKNKLDKDLKNLIEKNLYKEFRLIVQCKKTPEVIEKKMKSFGCSIIYFSKLLNCIFAIVPSKCVTKLLEFPDISYITIDEEAILCGETSILKSNGIYHIDKLNLSGRDVNIALIDSGTYPHPDLVKPKNRIKKFIDLINDHIYPYDDNGHGTFISGIMSGNGWNSKKEFCGVAPESNLISIKAFSSSGRAFTSTLIKALELILLDTELNIKVICLPFEFIHDNTYIGSIFYKLFKMAYLKNICVITPTGHNGPYPNSIKGIAALDNCLTIGGIDSTSYPFKQFANSSCGPINKLTKPDFCCGCVNICSLNCNTSFIPDTNGMKIYPKPLDTSYTVYSGTSIACAYVSGVCALLYHQNPDYSVEDIKSLLYNSCELLNLSNYCQGNGFLKLSNLKI